MDPAPFERDALGKPALSLAQYLARLDALVGADCPICKQNNGWLRPPGIERVVIPTSAENDLEALPYMCDQCGFLRLHLVSNYNSEANGAQRD